MQAHFPLDIITKTVKGNGNARKDLNVAVQVEIRVEIDSNQALLSVLQFQEDR